MALATAHLAKMLCTSHELRCERILGDEVHEVHLGRLQRDHAAILALVLLAPCSPNTCLASAPASDGMAQHLPGQALASSSAQTSQIFCKGVLAR